MGFVLFVFSKRIRFRFFNLTPYRQKQFVDRLLSARRESCGQVLHAFYILLLPVKCNKQISSVECFGKREKRNSSSTSATGLIIRFRNNSERSAVSLPSSSQRRSPPPTVIRAYYTKVVSDKWKKPISPFYISTLCTSERKFDRFF